MGGRIPIPLRGDTPKNKAIRRYRITTVSESRLTKQFLRYTYAACTSKSTETGYLTSCQPLPGQDEKLATLTMDQRITVWGEINIELGFEAVNGSLKNCLVVSS